MTPERWQKIEQVYHAALEREESQRGAYLHEVCAGDDELQREVESLLAQEKRGDGFLESPAIEVAAQALARDSRQSLNGQQLGSYKIVSLLGIGGMGEVYQAQDTKLRRDVAIKVLPVAFVHDPERLSRFQREARILASLNHPNIATIHGLEESGGVHYLVMELVPGETLAERLSAGPLGIEAALKICAQIAEALEAAHERGVIHRDLKPANVKVTSEGRVKVLDFGLAKAFGGDSELDLSLAPTLTAVGTEDGRILGTPAYMSPEQARGKTVDKRTDIWGFGCLLYELLAGKGAFCGETLSDTIAAVLEREPDWQALPGETPAKVRDLLRRCLQKDIHRRFRDAADIHIEIEEALTDFARGGQPNILKHPILLDWRRTLILSLGTLVLGVVLTTFTVWNLKPMPQRPVSRSVITLPPGQELAGPDDDPALAVSPDGTLIAYVARQGGNQQLYLRALDSLEAKPIPGTEGAISPFFSPDSQWLGFFAGGKMKKVSIDSGATLALEDAPLPDGASWNSRGMIAFAPSGASGLQQVSDAGGTPHPLTHLEKGEVAHRWPEYLPDGKDVLFAVGTSIPNWTNAQVVVQSVGTGKRWNLIQGGTEPRYASSGHLVYAHDGRLIAVPFNPQRVAITGTAVPVVEGVMQSPTSGAAQYSFSDTGLLIYVPAVTQVTQSTLVWVNRNGVERPLAAPARIYRNPRLSPDGLRVAIEIIDSESQVWLYDLSRETLTPITFGGNTNSTPVWTPDGKRIAFISTSAGPSNLFWQLADGSGGLERLTTSGHAQIPMSWSPDGQLLAFTEAVPATGLDLWVLRLGDRKAQPFLQTPANEIAPRFSPDGQWMAYMSDESGRNEIYVRPYPGPGGKWQISTEGGTEPVWNPNGRELFYRSKDKMIAVEIATNPSFVPGKPRMLFEGPYLATPMTSPYYDVAPDGQRFLMLKPTEPAHAARTQINVVLNWFEELKQKVPTGGK